MTQTENLPVNEEFAFIAGYTPNGVPFGITWDEWRQLPPEHRWADPQFDCPF